MLKPLKQLNFWFGFILLLIPFIVPILFPNNLYIVIIITVFFFFTYFFVYQNNEKEKRLLEHRELNELRKYYFSKDKKNIEKILSFAEIINNFYYDNQTQRIRSNIFMKDLHDYRIYAEYNMSSFPDHNVRIPENRGATGEAWLTKKQVWANKEEIFQGVHRLTIEEKGKIVKDLEWVCSTPIIRTNSEGNPETIAVLNIDGNKVVNDKILNERIQRTAIMIVYILNNYDLDCLKRDE